MGKKKDLKKGCCAQQVPLKARPSLETQPFRRALYHKPRSNPTEAPAQVTGFGAHAIASPVSISTDLLAALNFGVGSRRDPSCHYTPCPHPPANPHPPCPNIPQTFPTPPTFPQQPPNVPQVPPNDPQMSPKTPPMSPTRLPSARRDPHPRSRRSAGAQPSSPGPGGPPVSSRVVSCRIVSYRVVLSCGVPSRRPAPPPCPLRLPALEAPRPAPAAWGSRWPRPRGGGRRGRC